MRTSYRSWNSIAVPSRMTWDKWSTERCSYLDVYTAETSLLQQQQTFITLRVSQMTSNVQLIEALGGGWSRGQLPSEKDIAAK